LGCLIAPPTPAVLMRAELETVGDQPDQMYLLTPYARAAVVRHLARAASALAFASRPPARKVRLKPDATGDP
jgi:hypothetical protein